MDELRPRTDNADLPAFVVLITQGVGNMQALSARFWGSGFLPSEHQGCRLRSAGDPVLYLRDPAGVERADRRRMLDLVGELNEQEAERSLDPEVRTRIAQYELAYRMQMSVPDLVDFSTESPATLEMYGPDVHKPGSFAANCLLARRLSERGVRFVQLFMRGWDAHNNLPKEIRDQSKAVDQAQAALVKDLRQRGLLDETLVLWAGEFGRTVYSQGTLTHENYGRDHHPRCFTLWLAGGGVKPGMSYGRTDDYSYNIVENPVQGARPARDDATSAGHRSREAVVQASGAGFPPNRRVRQGGEGRRARVTVIACRDVAAHP